MLKNNIRETKLTHTHTHTHTYTYTPTHKWPKEKVNHISQKQLDYSHFMCVKNYVEKQHTYVKLNSHTPTYPHTHTHPHTHPHPHIHTYTLTHTQVAKGKGKSHFTEMIHIMMRNVHVYFDLTFQLNCRPSD